MSEKIEVDLDEIKRVFFMMEKIHDLLHQPMKFEDATYVNEFVKSNYIELNELYYDVIWDWLPTSEKEAIENR